MDTPFHVVGIDDDDGSATVLHEATNSGDARAWMLRYASKENAGNWNVIHVIDTRDECAETVFKWERDPDRDSAGNWIGTVEHENGWTP